MGGTPVVGVRRVAAVLVALLTVATVCGLAASPSAAVQTSQGVVVNPDPVNWTPDVLDGRVNTIAQVGDTIYLGGLFTRVRAASGGPELTRRNLLAFDASTGAIRPWAPEVNGEVEVIIPAGDGTSVYIGGAFSSIAGQSGRLARIHATTGARVASFVSPTLNGTVKDLRLVGNRLWVAGAFTHVAGVFQRGLATVNATTGARDPFMGLAIDGTHNGGTTVVMKIDVTPDGSRLFGIGNFTTVGGLSRRQAFALDLHGPAAAVANWQTDFYSSTCSNSFNSYMRDLDISPDGTYVVFTTTGAYAGGPPRSCDTQARFEVAAQGTGLQPTWVNYTGGDTTYAVAVTGTAVYVGGHFRWANNPLRGDRAGGGAVERSGIAALDPANGLPLDWNPGRTLGVGVFDLLATDQGLWVGSDTDRIGNWEFHGRIAMFPVAGGATLEPNNAGRLPGQLYLLGRSSGQNANAVRTRAFDGTTAGATTTVPSPIGWGSVRGAVMINDTLYTGWSDGSFVSRSFDGQSFGPATPVNVSDQLVVDTAWHTDVRTITGMFFDRGRLYYTIAGNSNLFYRYFTPSSRVVGAYRHTASGSVSGISFSQVQGMFLSGTHLYWATSDGNLRRIDFVNGAPVAGTATVVGGPNVDGNDWASRDLFVYAGDATLPNEAPTAVAAASCTELTCSVSGVGSADVDGTIAEYAWDFGDGATATGASAEHTYAAAGTYTITLTVTDDGGATAQVTTEVTVEATNVAPTAIASATCDELSCTFDGSASVDQDGELTSWVWDLGDGATAASPIAHHTYVAPGTYTATLTVTDDKGATGTATVTVDAAVEAADIAFVDATSTSANATTHRVTVPASVAAGDALVLFVTSNNPAATTSAPTGGGTWQQLGSASTSSVLTRVYGATAGGDAAGSTVTITTSEFAKVNVTLVAYRGASVAAVAGTAESGAKPAHATPAATVSAPGSWVVSYWAHKDSATTELTPDASVTARSAAAGTGGGRIASLAADSGGPVPPGTVGGAVATAGASSAHATMWTIVLVRS